MSQILGEEIIKMSKNKSLAEVVFLMWKGRLPKKMELKLFEAMLIMAVDHGNEPPSAKATLLAMEKTNNLSESVAEGIKQINSSHGGAIEPLINILKDKKPLEKVIKDFLSNGNRIPGFGHRIYKDEDPRTVALFNLAKKYGFSGKYVNRARQIERILEKQKGIKLPINIDGALAALICELGFTPNIANGFFIFPRVAGLIARATNKI